MKTKKMIFCALFITLITVGAYIRIPAPLVSFTLQPQFVMLCGLLLGAKSGFITLSVYILMGLSGLPVFSGGGGLTYLLQPTFGYVIGFAAAAYIIGKISRKQKNPNSRQLLQALFSGLGVMYLIGTVYFILISHFYLGQELELWSVIVGCCLITLPKDIILCFVTASIGKRLRVILEKM